MKVNEIIVEDETPTRFRKQSNTAIFNGKPGDPKKILIAFKNSLNHATEMNWKLKPVSITDDGFIGELTYHDWNSPDNDGSREKECMVTVKVQWGHHRGGTIRKPRIELNIFNSHDEMNLINYRIELDDETVANMWSPMTVKTIHEYVEEEENYYATDDPDPEDEDDENWQEQGAWVDGQWDPDAYP